MVRERGVRASLCGLMVLCLAIPAHTQTGTASVVGTVTDPSGAAVPHAEVIARNTETSVSRTTATTSTGDYSFPGLAPGHYTVTVRKSGFAVMELSRFRLRIGHTARVNVVLAVGEVSQTVSVQAQGMGLETDSGTVGQVIDNRK